MDILIILVVVAAMGIFIGVLFWYENNWWRPRQKQVLMRCGPLTALRSRGFVPTAAAFAGELVGSAALAPVAFVGTVSGYATEVSYGWTERTHVLVRVFFEPGSHDYEEIMHSWHTNMVWTNEWNFAEGAYCAPVYADAQLPYWFQCPSMEQMVALAEKITQHLKALGKAPITYEPGRDLAMQVLAESKSRSEARE